MKNFFFNFTFSVFCFVNFTTYSQLLNNSFEEWNSVDPVNWSSSDESLIVNGIMQSPEAHAGNYSARLEVVNFSDIIYPAWIWSVDDAGNYHSISTRYKNLEGWYKFSSLEFDQLYFVVAMMDDEFNVVGSGFLAIQSSTGNWTEFTVPIFYQPGFPEPVQCLVTIGVIDSTGATNPGSFALIDDLSFSGLTDVEKTSKVPKEFMLFQNYPNPFNPATKIEYSIPEATFVQLKVYDVLGNEVVTLVNEERSAGVYHADFSGSNLASGLYVAQIITGNYSQTIKMILLK